MSDESKDQKSPWWKNSKIVVQIVAPIIGLIGAGIVAPYVQHTLSTSPSSLVSQTPTAIYILPTTPTTTAPTTPANKAPTTPANKAPTTPTTTAPTTPANIIPSTSTVLSKSITSITLVIPPNIKQQIVKSIGGFYNPPTIYYLIALSIVLIIFSRRGRILFLFTTILISALLIGGILSYILSSDLNNQSTSLTLTIPSNVKELITFITSLFVPPMLYVAIIIIGALLSSMVYFRTRSF